MFPVLTLLEYAAAVILTLWGALGAIRNRPAGRGLLGFAAFVLLLLLVQLVVGIAAFGGHSGTDPLLFFGYVATAIVLMPLAGVWAFAELSRWGPLVLMAAGITVFVMVVRMDQIWQ
ncbi:hypothetical protein GSY69_09580 [Brevibacterium sp. 5221]|uniref:Integral membrane protein n=1 Tax=Brevibacterium rongguiense TaxID=2695267 RepID=A0A6N9H867_9MICO|nr:MULTISPECIES: hypothetical protein [Brevibacterium]MYM20210.1 hypothetical protein [Brevibacterium rongguiense]WAL41428.1 hypothetical protein BRM1_06180 [Brevibacterium sp. BRM-1]